MKALLDSFVVAAYLFAVLWGGRYSLSYMAYKAQKMALEKVAKGI